MIDLKNSVNNGVHPELALNLDINNNRNKNLQKKPKQKNQLQHKELNNIRKPNSNFNSESKLPFTSIFEFEINIFTPILPNKSANISFSYWKINQ